jgi:hypothetical protein
LSAPDEKVQVVNGEPPSSHGVPGLNSDSSSTLPTTDFIALTEISGDEVTAEQVERLARRYFWVGDYCHDKDVLEVACGATAPVVVHAPGHDYVSRVELNSGVDASLPARLPSRVVGHPATNLIASLPEVNSSS